jgi:MFS family permease
MLKKRRVFYGWWIVLAAGILRFFAGGVFIYGRTTFFNPIRTTFGWTATATSVAYSLQTVESGILSPIAGFLVDRFGPRKLMLLGWGIFGLGFLWMSRINSLWEFYVAFLLVAAGSSLGTMVVVYTTIAHWFNKKRSRAFTLTNVPMQFGGVLVPLVALSIIEFGWRTGLFIIGVSSLVIGLPLALLFRHKPGQYGLSPDDEPVRAEKGTTDISPIASLNETTGQDSGSLENGLTWQEALRTPAFWSISIAFLFQHVGTNAVGVHIVPYLESINFSTTIAATVVTGVSVGGAIGGLIFGLLGDFTSKRYLIAITLALQATGLLVFSLMDADRHWLISLFLLSYAIGYGAPFPLRHAMLADYFGTRNYGTISGLMSTVSIIGGLASPVIAGWIFDITGSYHLAWRLFALVTFPAAAIILLAKLPKAMQKP